MREDDRDEPVQAELSMSSPSSDRPADSVDPKLLEILVCPLTKTPLEYDAEKQELISRAAQLARAQPSRADCARAARRPPRCWSWGRGGGVGGGGGGGGPSPPGSA